MPEFIVYRHGWNRVNQDPEKGLPEKMAVARIEAENADDACRLAKPQVVLLPPQYLSAEPASIVDSKEELLNRKA